MTNSLSGYRYFEALDGARLAYRIGGPAGELPVLLLHALAARTKTWDKVFAVLVHSGRQVIVVDLRGHGRSARAKRYALSDFADDTIALMDLLGLEQADLVGHSLGGYVALTVAQLAPRRVRRLLVEETPIPPRDEEEAEMLRRQRSKNSVSAVLSLAQSLAVLLWRRFDLRMARPLIASLRLPMPAWWAGLGAIEASTLLLGGTRSPIAQERLARLTAAIPNAKQCMLEGGHRLHSEQLPAFIAVALSFLGEAPP
jgi:esterase